MQRTKDKPQGMGAEPVLKADQGVGSAGKGKKPPIPSEKEKEELESAFQAMNLSLEHMNQTTLAKRAGVAKEKAGWWVNNILLARLGYKDLNHINKINRSKTKKTNLVSIKLQS